MEKKTPMFNRKIADNVRLSINQTLSESSGKINRLPKFKRSPLSGLGDVSEDIRTKLVREKGFEVMFTAEDKKRFEDEVMSGNQYFDRVSDESSISIEEARDVLGALPDIRIAMRILVNAIISPNDMISKELLYSCNTTYFGDVTPALLEVIKNYFDNDYKIKGKLSTMLQKALFMEGSYINVVLPESSIDDAINTNLVVSTESMNSLRASMDNELGLLGTVETRKDSGVTPNLGYTISDNYEFFKLPVFEKKKIQDSVAGKIYRKSLRSSTESTSDKQLNNLFKDIYPERKDDTVNLITMKTIEDLSKPTRGHPIVINVPVEAFIPVYVPSEPDNHVGGFILLDKSGNPITKREEYDQYRDLNSSFKSTYNEIAGGLIQASADKMLSVDGSRMTGDTVDDEYVQKVYSLIFEKDLKNRLEKGSVYNTDLEVGLLPKISRIMFSRACSQLETKVVYVPKELFSFLAFDYKDNGLGRSLLESSKAQSSLRMVQEMADSLANIRNSIDHKDVVLKLDPNDPDPMKTMNEMLHSIQRSTKMSTPIGMLNYADIATAFQTRGWNVRAEGHEGMPDTSIEYNQHTKSYAKPDSTYAERLRDNQILGFGLSPDSISGVMGSEFATNVVSSNVFLAQDALEKQETFSTFLQDFIIKYTRNSSILMERLEDIIEKNRKNITIAKNPKYTNEVLAILFVNNISISLPKPDLSKISLQSEALDAYIGMVEKAVDYVVSEDLISEENVGEQLAHTLPQIIEFTKRTLIRNYMIDNNVLPELFQMMYVQPDDYSQSNLFKLHEQYLSAIIPSIQQYSAWAYDNKLKLEKRMEIVHSKLEEKYGDAEDMEEDDDYDSDDEDTGDDEDGGDDFGDDEGGDDSVLEDDGWDESDDNLDADDAMNFLEDIEDDMDDL